MAVAGKTLIGLLIFLLIANTSVLPCMAAAGLPDPEIKMLPPVVDSEPAQNPVAKVTGDYILGPGDLLSVVDYSAGQSSSPREMPILPDGTVNIFPVGVLRAAGLSLRQFNELVNEKAAKYFVEPQLDITVREVRAADVYVVGEVANPGLYATHSIHEDTSGFDVTPTIVTALQRAGGLKDSADVTHIRVTRLSSSQPIYANLWDILVYGDTKQDIPLQSGDTIFVPRGGYRYDPNSLGLAAHRERAVRVWGQVRTPGLYVLKPGDDLMSAIASAGGLTGYASNYVWLSRLNRDGTVSNQKVSIKRSLTNINYIGRRSVEAGDIVIVPESISKRVAAGVYRAGFVIGTGIALVLFSYKTKNINALGNSRNNSSTPNSIFGVPF